MGAAPCWLCGSGRWEPPFAAVEMMFGTRASFDYRSCSGCGSLQIVEPPPDLAAHYPSSYYSFGAEPIPLPSPWKRALRARAADHALGRRTVLGRALAGRGATKLWPPRVGHAITSRRDRILDVGCGTGELLRWLWGDGFDDLAGVEPFLPTPAGQPFPVASRISADAVFDVVMFHHSLEHQAEPVGVLRTYTECLAPGGRLVVRLPVADSEAAAEYGPHWAHLDPPRHLFVPTRVGVAALAEAAGLRLVEEWQDPTSFGFWASELYRCGEPLHPGGTPRDLPPAGRFSADQLARFEDRNRRAVERGRGDQAGFVLVRAA